MTGSVPITPDGLLLNQGTYQGYLACDGGLTDCTPHFKDSLRSQMVVVITELRSGPFAIDDADLVILGHYDTAKALALMKKGQDDVVAWLFNQSWKINNEMFQLKDESTDWPPYGCTGESMVMEIAAVFIGMMLVDICLVAGCVWCGCLMGRRWAEEYDVNHGDEDTLRHRARNTFRISTRGLAIHTE
mmetsp:Transcript_2452/g.4089  ORF Transcript_2452/g.4089 Transcript_2452/m.4089 type:complete len:188 (+) Transcript_2452:2-565(+)